MRQRQLSRVHIKPHIVVRKAPLASPRRRKPAQVVERKLRCCSRLRQLRRRRRIEIAQQAKTNALLGHRPQLLLDRLERPAKRGAPRQRIRKLDPRHIQPDRIEAREPAHRPRQVERPKLLAAVTLDIHQHRRPAPTPAPPAPVAQRNRKSGQQHLLHAAMKARRHLRQQRLRHRSRQRHLQMARRPDNVAPGIERAIQQRQRRLTQQVPPERQLRNHPRIQRVRRKLMRPAPERGPARRQLNRLPRRSLSPRRRQVRHQDPPRHPVHHQMMQHQQQPAGAIRPAVNPHRLQHRPRRWRQPARRSPRRRRNLSPQARIVETAAIDPPQARPRRNRTRSRNRKPPRPIRRHRQPQPQRIVMVEQSLQRRRKLRLPHAPRHPQQRGLAEPVDRAAALSQPLHDRRRRQLADRPVVGHRRRRLDRPGDRRQSRHRLMLEHRPRRQQKPRPPCTAHQLDRHDAVAAKLEEAVLDADPFDPQHLGKQPAQQRLLRRARRTVRTGRPQCSGAGSARRSSLPFGVSGRRSRTTSADGTMCSGSTPESPARSAERSSSAPAAATT